MKSGINIDRILNDIAWVTGGGKACCRPSYSEADAAARAYFNAIFESLDLAVSVDGAGNIRAALAGREPGLAPVLAGSHIDTVKNGGRFDGLLGTVCALECLRVFRENGYVPRRTTELIIFAEEEATNFGVTLLGSKLLTGMLAPGALKALVNDAGESADAVMRRAGFDPDRFSLDHSSEGGETIRSGDVDVYSETIGRGDVDVYSETIGRGDAYSKTLRRGDVHAMIEMHIEQGPFLDKQGVPVGIVERIAMQDRRDPMIGAAEVVLGIRDIAESAGTGTAVATVGKITARPGAANIIAGEVEFFVDIRDMEDDSIDCIVKELAALTEESAHNHGLTVEINRIAKSQAVTLDPGIVDLIQQSANDLDVSAVRMNSGAVHDAVMMAGVARTGMIFVQSIGGLSHCPEEDTRAADIEAGANVLMETIRRIAEEE